MTEMKNMCIMGDIMKKNISVFFALFLLPVLLNAAEAELTQFDTLAAAQKEGWSAAGAAKISMPTPGVLRATGMNKRPYCGLRLKQVLSPNASGSISFKFRTNVGKSVHVGFSTQAGYFRLNMRTKPNQWQKIDIPLNIERWSFSGKVKKPTQWGKVTALTIANSRMKKTSEFIEIRNLRMSNIGEQTATDNVTVSPGMPVLTGDLASYYLTPTTGALYSVRDLKNNKWVVIGTENHYFVQRKSKDAEAFESNDRVTKFQKDNGRLTFHCVNPDLPGIEIVKRYHLEGKRLRRKLEFYNSGRDTAYITPRTRVKFTQSFYHNGFYLGSGYIGPLMPVPQLDAPKEEKAFKQTTKGMLLYHDNQTGSFTQYRTHLNGKFVFPWWQSAIPSYQEDANALFYQPDGWEMALGTIDVLANKKFSIEDCFVFFEGNWYTFLNDIYPNDPRVKKVLGAFQPGPEWLNDVKVQLSTRNIHEIEQLANLIDDGEIIYISGILGAWADYRVGDSREGEKGGRISGEELKEFMAKLRSLSPRLRLGIYNWVSSVSVLSPIFKEHPEYFMLKERSGADKNLFPGLFQLNHPTMINRPEAAKFMLDNFRYMIDYLNVDFIYLDETKTTSLIDWQHNDLVRDDHWNDFWLEMYKLGHKHNIVMFSNGRGNPYHELNFIEARHQLNPKRWREFCGMAMAVANFVNNRKGARLDLLYWNPKMDYINRVLANGFIPTINFLSYQQIPYVTANAELGKSTGYNLKYTPDWKNDASTELESYCIQRNAGKELVFSVINRSTQDSIQATLDVAGLGTNLTVWCYRIMRYPDNKKWKYGFGERERKSNYSATGWREGVIAAPELVYSGKNPGKLKLKLDNFPNGEFAQFIISNSDGGVYSVNNMPQNFFLTKTSKVTVTGDKLPLTIDSIADRAEIIVAKAPGIYSVNGKKVKSKVAEFGGKFFAVIPVGKGKFRVDYSGKADYPSPPFNAQVKDGKLLLSQNSGFVTIKKDNLLYYCGNKPQLPDFHAAATLQLNTLDGKHPIKIKIANGKPSPAMLIKKPPLQPAVCEIKTVAPIQRDGAEIIGLARYMSRWRSTNGIQTNMSPFIASADLKTLTLTAGTSDKVGDNLGHTAGGFLLKNADKVELEFSSTFPDGGGILRPHVYRYRRHSSEFAGIMLDFEQKKGSFERVALSTGVLNHTRTLPGSHQYGSKKTADKVFTLGNWLDDHRKRVFSLDLKKLAPKDWDGKVFLSVATGWINPGRRITLKLLAFNQKASAPEVVPASLKEFNAEFNAPREFIVPRLKTPAKFYNIFKHGFVIPRFYKVGGSGFPVFQTRAALSCDANNLYLGFDTGEDDTMNNHVEIWLRGTNGILWQFICNTNGSYQTYRNNLENSDQRMQLTKVSSGRFLVKIPFTMTGKPVSGKAWRFNICRWRPADTAQADEISTYAPLEKRFNEQDKFASITFPDNLH